MATITCGHCKSTHASVAEVAECAWYEAEAKYEYEAERAAERYWEEGPNGPQDDPRERELWALEDERRKAWGGGQHPATWPGYIDRR